VKQVNYQFNFPIEVIYGVDSLGKLPEVLERFLARRIFIVTDKGVIGAGVINRVRSLLGNGKYEIETFASVEANPRDTTVMSGVEEFKKFHPDMVLGIGGGSSMDTAKAIRAVVRAGGRINQYEGFNKFRVKPETALIAIPTTAGTGSEMGGWAVITDTARKFKMGFGDPLALSPTISIVDPKLTLTLPASMTAASGMDAFAHAVEVYVSVASSPITDALALKAIELIFGNLKTAWSNGKNLTARANVMYGSMIAGMAMSNADCGAIHAVAEVVGGLYDISHGLSIASFTPHVMKYNCEAVVDKMGNITRAMGAKVEGMSNRDAAQLAWRRAAELAGSLEIPRPSELGIEKSRIREIATLCTQNMSSGGNPKPMKEADYEGVLNDCLSEQLW
jgi:alcohol dehydrogenase